MKHFYHPIWSCQYTQQYQFQGTLYAGLHAGRGKCRPPVAYISGANCDLWRVTSGVLSNTHLFVKFKHPFCQNPHQGSIWPGHAYQPSTTSGPHRGNLGGSTCNSQKGWLFEAMDLQGLGEWPEAEQEQARELLFKWEHLFACSDLDLGRTTLIKHQVEITEWMPFKEHYQCIPSHMYDDMKTHLQEMLDIDAIWKSHNPWVSAVVLVQKKDGSLRFCINLRKLNNRTIRDVYSLPHVDETLDSLQGSQWFPSLDLKSAYWRHMKWTGRGNLWLHLPWGHWGSMSVKDAFWTNQCPHNLPETNGDLSWGP